MNDLLRVYFNPLEIGRDGYPRWWHRESFWPETGESFPAIKDLIRERDGHRCLRCGHPYRKGEHGNGEWSSCDERCSHGGPVRLRDAYLNGEDGWRMFDVIPETAAEARLGEGPEGLRERYDVEAAWRILTVHHLNGVKHDCRWWNLVSLCQRCHLSIQTRVVMEREYDREHSEWFKPFAAGWYAWRYLGEELSREETMTRLEELLALEQRQESLPI
jgi:hypothetical protein